MKKFYFTEKQKMMAAIDQILAGEESTVDVSRFHNKAYANKINQLIEYTKSLNNPTVMRLNSAMGALGDNTLIKQTFDQVGIQSGLLNNMQDSHQSIEASIGDISENMANIRNNTKNLLEFSSQVVVSMTDNVRKIQVSATKLSGIDQELQDFRESIATIHRIVDSVQNIARESNILALNASIEAGRAGEAGKGFNVLAENMRALSSNVQESSEEIGALMEQIATTVENIAGSMNEATQVLMQENVQTEESLSDMGKMNQQLTDIEERLNTIFNAIDLQTASTHNFAKQMTMLYESNQSLSGDCLSLGKQMFKLGRYNDKTRSDLLKKNAKVSTRDLLSVFEVDHYVLTWRVYNNIVGFEQLKSSQVDDPTGCKLGKWITANASSPLGQTEEFRAVKRAHEQLHNFATESFKAKSEGNEQKALAAFDKTLESFYVLQQSIHVLDQRMQSQGDCSVTEYVEF